MEILIIDIETTDFQGKGGKIVEVGIISLNLESGEKKILFDKVVHERPITRKEVEESWIVTNGYMSVEEIQNSPQLALLIPEIQSILDAYPLGATAYNRAFDFNFLESRGVRFPRKLPCLMLLSTDICQLSGKYGSYKWPKVEEAYNHFFGTDHGYVEKHRGADDAFHEADIVLALYRMGVFKID